MKQKSMATVVMICVVCVAMMAGCLEGEVASVEAVRDSNDVGEILEQPAARPTPDLIKFGTYSNPVPLGNVLTSSTGALNIGVALVKRGEVVNNMAQRENMFNDEPKSGNEYMLTYMVVEYKEMDHLDVDEKFSLSGYDFGAYANGVECDNPFLVLPDEFDTSFSTSMMPGSVSGVWLIYEVPKDEQVTIAYDRIFVGEPYYFDAGTGDFEWGTD